MLSLSSYYFPLFFAFLYFSSLSEGLLVWDSNSTSEKKNVKEDQLIWSLEISDFRNQLCAMLCKAWPECPLLSFAELQQSGQPHSWPSSHFKLGFHSRQKCQLRFVTVSEFVRWATQHPKWIREHCGWILHSDERVLHQPRYLREEFQFLHEHEQCKRRCLRNDRNSQAWAAEVATKCIPSHQRSFSHLGGSSERSPLGECESSQASKWSDSFCDFARQIEADLTHLWEDQQIPEFQGPVRWLALQKKEVGWECVWNDVGNHGQSEMPV